MSDESKKENSIEWNELEPLLEEPTTVEIPEAGVGTLIEENMAMLASKLTAVESFFRLITSDLKFQDFMRESLLVIMKAVKTEAGSILEVDVKKQNIFFRTAVGHSSDRVVRFVIPLGKGIVGHVIESMQPLNVSNIGENADHLKSIANAVGFNVRNLAAIPIIIRGKVFGVIELLNRVGAENFSNQDIEFLMSVVQFFSKAIEVRLMIAWSTQQKSKQDVA